MLGLGNVSAARMLYQRAADAGVGVAARKLAETYDPAFLTAHDLRGIKPDPVAAGAWYRRAEALGDAEAIERLRSQQGRTLADSLATH
jgi:TPR repeat protein